ncbi:hypothetical protein [Acidisoma sp. L85]|jgi:hypothetical protein|uniref:hypothetical protein n=1 Tax=Acidisoma sp. L85 TaxID=1641850 RepID=UPI00131E7ADB|nr:hypothetical protein [Acidisoma sp. L85]
MPVPAPELHWPAELVEAGPQADPSILLGGTATLNGVQHHVYALRINLDHITPDFRADLDQSLYADHELGVMLDEVFYFGGVSRSSIVELESNHYIIWMVPSGSSSGV